MESKTLVPIVACLVVVAAVAVAGVFVLTNGDNNGESKDSLVIEEGTTITQEQLVKLKEKAASDSKVKLTYKSSNYTVVFDSKAIANINEVADISVAAVESSSLPEENQTALGDSSKIVNISYGSNTDFGDGTVTVSIPYELKSNQTGDNIVVTYIDGSDKMSNVSCSYADGNASFTTTHFSKYAISYANSLKGAELKALGNVNGDNTFTAEDKTLLEKIISSGTTFELNSIADANNDGKIDESDVTYLNNILAAVADTTLATKATVWHLNYHDTNGDGHMDTELVSTTFPITSTIMTGSANSFILLYTMGIIDEVKGASYGSTNDTWLYSDTYLKTSHTANLGKSSTSITFEDGKAGSSNIIAEQNVTCAISDWNRTYLENESAFEAANVDVVRVAAASFDTPVYTHSINLLGLLFAKQVNAAKLLKVYNEAKETIDTSLATLSENQIRKAVASSMTGYLSSDGSDYSAFCEYAGAKFGLEGYDFGGSTSVKVSSAKGVFDTRQYQYDNIVHIRTALTYGSTTQDVAGYWADYANAMSLWEHAYDGQVLVSGAIPVPARVAYIAYAIYGDILPDLSKSWADGIHAGFTTLYAKDISGAPNKTLVLNSYKYTVTIKDGVTVKDVNGNTIADGTEFPYGTKLFLSATVVKDGFTLRADGSTLNDDGSFIVCDNIVARYVDNEVMDKLTKAADDFATAYDTGVYGTATAAEKNEGVFNIKYTYYDGKEQNKDYTIVYKDTAADALAEFNALKTKAEGKSASEIYQGAEFTNGEFDGIYAKFSSSAKADKYVYSTLYLCAYKGNMVVNMVDVYPTYYYLPATDEYKTYVSDDAGRLTFFTNGVKALTKALSIALNPLDDTQANTAASQFASAYKGVFGTYTAKDNTATAVVSDTDRVLTFSVSAAPDKVMDAAIKAVDLSKYTEEEGWSLIKVNEYSGLDDVNVFVRSKTMGTKDVSMMYVAAYKGNIVVDGYTVNQYTNSGFATTDDVNAFLAALVTAMTIS